MNHNLVNFDVQLQETKNEYQNQKYVALTQKSKRSVNS